MANEKVLSFRFKFIVASNFTVSIRNVLYILNRQRTYDLGRMNIKILCSPSFVTIFASASKKYQIISKAFTPWINTLNAGF